MVNLSPALDALTEHFGARSSTSLSVRRDHCSRLTWLQSEPPDIVVWPQSVAEVQTIVQIAQQFQVPIVCFGSGTSLEGQVNAPLGGIAVNFSRMNRILHVNTEDLDVTVEPGVTLQQLTEIIRDTGYFFPVDPGASTATLGGMAATRASGTTTVRYGAMRENVLNLDVVLANGEVLKTGTRARKSAAGYDLTRLMIGSEGTLGLFVSLTLRLVPRPEVFLSSIYTFPDLAAVAQTTLETVAAGILVDRIELLDSLMLTVLNNQKLGQFPAEGPALFVEFSGTPKATQEHRDLFQDIARSHGAHHLSSATNETERKKLWTARHNCFWSVQSAWPGRALVVTDVCVPLSRLQECLTKTLEDSASHQLIAPLLGHVGDGNFHAIVVVNSEDKKEKERLESFLQRLAERAIQLGGTCTGEHGIGQGKARYLPLEMGVGVEVMRHVKKALDPQNILNPGKIFSIF